jgi:hypothetical protein
MPTRFLTILVAVLFLLTIIARLPAAWVVATHPAGGECTLPAGSVWHGSCGQLRAGPVALAGLSWQLHAWPLLRAHVDLDVTSADARLPGTAAVSLAGGGRVVVHDLRADLPVDAGLLPVFPSGWSGDLQLAFTSLEFNSGRLRALVGTVTARRLAQRSPAMPIGSYELRFPATPAGTAADPAAIVGDLHDLDGPLAVTGRLILRNGSDYELSGTVAVRPGASPELAKGVEFLGPADAQGRRPFSMAGTF